MNDTVESTAKQSSIEAAPHFICPQDAECLFLDIKVHPPTVKFADKYPLREKWPTDNKGLRG